MRARICVILPMRLHNQPGSLDSFLPMDLPSLSVWYLSPLRRCNFRCAYCASGQPWILNRDEWASERDRDNHFKVMEWLGRLPYRLKLRINTIGEPFASDDYLDSIAQLSRSENIEFLEILTNGSYAETKLKNLAEKSDPKKLRFWMTFHPTQITLDRFIQAAQLAQKQGISVVAHGLIFPDTIDSTLALKESCDREQLRLHVGLGLNINNSYSKKEFEQFHRKSTLPQEVLDLHVTFGGSVQKLADAPYGSPCAAGHDYIFITQMGDVHQCRTYSIDPEKQRLGSALDPGFELKLRKSVYENCGARTKCVCTEDNQHLKKAREGYSSEAVSFIPWSKNQFIARANP